MSQVYDMNVIVGDTAQKSLNRRRAIARLPAQATFKLPTAYFFAQQASTPANVQAAVPLSGQFFTNGHFGVPFKGQSAVFAGLVKPNSAPPASRTAVLNINAFCFIKREG